MDGFNKKSTGKTQITLRISDKLLKEIENECEYLGVTRNGWLAMVADLALRHSKKDRTYKNPDAVPTAGV
jgi:predicted DNA binding CopG/RHH family protein